MDTRLWRWVDFAAYLHFPALICRRKHCSWHPRIGRQTYCSFRIFFWHIFIAEYSPALFAISGSMYLHLPKMELHIPRNTRGAMYHAIWCEPQNSHSSHIRSWRTHHRRSTWDQNISPRESASWRADPLPITTILSYVFQLNKNTPWKNCVDYMN